MTEPDRRASGESTSSEPAPQYRPIERFWPYVDLPEQPSDEELAALDPELAAALFGRPTQPFSLTITFVPFDGADYAKAVELAKASVEYRELGSGATLQHRARFQSTQAREVQALWQFIGRFDRTEVLLDDQPVPYAKQLWLPLLWLLNY